MTHPQLAELAKAFESESAALLKLIAAKKPHLEALVRLMRKNMLKLPAPTASH